MPHDDLFIHRLEYQDYMKIKVFRVEPHGKSFRVLGKNAKGKTTSIDGIMELFATDSRNRPEAIREGAEKAIIAIDLCDDAGEVQFRLQKTITPGSRSGRLIITDGPGNKIASQKELLAKFFTSYSIDPIKFKERREQDQIDDILEVCGVKPPVAQVKMITGEDHPAKPGETADAYMQRLSGDDTGVYFLSRLNAGREVTRLAGAIAKQKSMVDDLEAVPIATTRTANEIIADQAALLEKQKVRDNAIAIAQDAHHKWSAAKTLLADKQSRVVEIKDEIAQLEMKLKKAKDTLYSLEIDCKTAKLDATDAENEHADALKIVDGLPDQGKQLKAIKEELDSGLRNQKAITDRKTAKDRLRELAEEKETAEMYHIKAEQVLGDLRELRRQILENLDLGVPNLSVVNGSLRLNGKPFVQASEAEQIRVSMGVAMRRNPQLKLIRIDRGESLDEESQEYLFQLAHAKGWQIVMACVSKDQELRAELWEGDE